MAEIGLEEISGIGKKTAERLKSAGVTSVQKLAAMTIDELMELDIKGIGRTTADKYLDYAKKVLEDNKSQEDPPSAPTSPSKSDSEDQLHLTEDEKKSNTLRILSKFFKPDVLDIEDKDDRKILKEVIVKSIDSLRFLTKKDVNFIKASLMVTKIEELINFKEKNIFNFISSSQLKIMEKEGVVVKDMIERIEKAITISSILSQLHDRRIELRNEQQKVIIAGLDRAGKTAILQTFGGKLGIKDLTKLSPTKKVHRRKIQTKDLLLFLWDFGGQTKYRHEYLKNPGSYFLSIDLMIYVIDVQDYHRYEEAFSYFEDILEALKTLEENPHLLIMLHKFDPDIRDDPEVQLNIEFLKENMKEILIKKHFDYEIYLTSIYTFISREPKFTKFLKKMVSHNDLIADPTSDKLEELAKIVDNALNAIIKLSESISEQFNDLGIKFNNFERRLALLENSKKSTSTSESSTASPPASFSASKSTLDRILEKTTEGSTSTSLIPSIPSPNRARFDELHPPPSPVLSSTQDSSENPSPGRNLRGSIIEELKDLFTRVKKQDY